MRQRLAVLLFGLLAAAVASGQDRDGRAQGTLATLPQSNEALVLSSQVEQALQVGDHRLAIELIGRIMNLPSNLVAAPASRTFYPVWRHAFLLYGRLSEQGVAQYRQLYDGEVATRFEQAAAGGDLPALRTLFHRHRVSTHWPAIGNDLVARLLDRGRYGEAIEVLREMNWAGVSGAGEVELQLAVALGKAGAWQAARSIVAGLEADPEVDAAAALVRAWLAEQELARGGVQAYLLDEYGAWHTDLPLGREADPRNIDLEVYDAVEALQRLPLTRLVRAGERLVLRQGGRIRALDALTLTLLWEVPEIPADGSFLDSTVPDRVVIPQMRNTRLPDDDALQIGPETRLLLNNEFRHLLTADGGRIFTIEGLTLTASDDLMRTRSFMTTDAIVFPNELVCRSADDGRVLWRTGQRETDPLAGVEFQDRPLVFGERLVVPIRRENRVSLLELEAQTGAPLREVQIVGPPIHFTREGGRFQTVADATTIYLTTGNGVVAAVGRDSLEWKWATVYPSTVAEHLGRLWWKPPVEPRESGIDRPVLANDVLVLAPIDSLEIFALDRFSGRERWRIPRREYTHLVGSVSAGIVLGANALVCLDLENPGGPARWRSVPLEIVGRSVVHDDRVFVPTRTGVVVLDGATGKVVGDQLGGDMRVAGEGIDGYTLLAGDEALYTLSNSRVTKYPAPRATRVHAESSAASADSFRSVLGLAWLAALHGEFDSAREMLSDLVIDQQRYERSRRQLLLHVCLQLAERSDEPRERIAWLRQAGDLAEAPAERARLGLRIGAAFERLEDWPAALKYYCELLARDEPVTVERDPRSTGTRRVATWLLAVERIRGLQPYLDDDDGVIRDFAHRLVQPDEVRMRLFAALPPGPIRTELAAEILRGPLAPELKQPYLHEDFAAAGLPEGAYRETLLRRWETFVALGHEAEAEAARAAFDALPPDEGAAAADAQLLRSIRLSAAKLDGPPTPFGPNLYRTWLLPHAELLLDREALSEPWWRWLPVRNLGAFEIQLINVGRYEDYPHRRTHDGLTRATRETPEPERNLLGERRGWDQNRLGYWPMRRTRSLAVVPVQEGVVAVGFGPERGGGRRLWEYAIPGWRTIPLEFERTSTVDEGGVCLRERSGRIVRLGWADGAVRWQRDFGKLDVLSLVRHGDRLLIRTDDLRVWSCRLDDGGDLRPLPLPESAIDLAVVAGQVLVIGARTLAAFDLDGDDYALRWARPVTGLITAQTIAGSSWLLVSGAGREEWDVLDARTGADVLPVRLTGYQTIQAACVDGDRLLLAGQVAGARNEPDPVEIAAYELERGTAVWRRAIVTEVPVNVTQLQGHPDLVPIGVHGGSGDGLRGWPQVALVSKVDGGIVRQQDLQGDFDRREDAACGLRIMVAGGQLLVQSDANVIAYGTSPLEGP